MTALPTAAELTAAALTNAEMKTLVTELHDFLAGLLGEDGVQATALAAIDAPFSSLAVKSGTYTVDEASDRGRVFMCSGTWTLTLPNPADAGGSFTCAMVNTDTGVITVTPEAGTIDGLASKDYSTGMVLFFCDGSDWFSLGVPIAAHGTQLFTSSGSFTVPAGVTQVQAYVIGAGGGGGGMHGAHYAAGTGGTSSFGGITAGGGAGGTTGIYPIGPSGTPGAAGSGSGGSYGAIAVNMKATTPALTGTTYGNGGVAGSLGGYSGGVGGAGAARFGFVSVTPGEILTVTIGTGGAGNGYYAYGSAGQVGAVAIFW